MSRLISKISPTIQQYTLAVNLNFIAIASLTILGIFTIFSTQIHTDVIFILNNLEKALDKNLNLYETLIDINSPLIYYYNFIPIKVAQTFTIDTIISFKAFTLIITGLIIKIIIVPLLNELFPPKLTSLLTGTLIIIAVFAGWSFGQREYLVFFLSIPYVLTIARTNVSKYLTYTTVCSGVLLSIALLIKPTYLIMPITLTFYLMLRNKSLSPIFSVINIILVISLLGLSIFIWILFPSYAQTVIPGFLLYSRFYSPYPTIIRTELFVLLIVCCWYVVLYRFKRLPTITHIFFLTLLCYWLAEILQNKGWSHHYFPFNSLAIFLMAYCTYVCFFKFKDKSVLWYFLPSSFFIITYIIISTNVMHAIVPPLSINTDRFNNIVQYIYSNTHENKILVFTTEIYPMTIIDYDNNITWMGSYRNFWNLPGYYNLPNYQQSPFPYHGSDEMPLDERVFNEIVIRDIHQRPELIFINNSRFMNGFGYTSFNYVEYFSLNTQFNEFLAKNYTYKENFDGFEVYKLINSNETIN